MPAPLTPEEIDYAKKIEECVIKRDIAALQKLLQSKRDVNLDALGLSPLLFELVEEMANEIQFRIIKILLDHGANLNIKDREAMSPLMKAAINQDRKVCQLFIEKGADLSRNMIRFLRDREYEFDAIYLKSFTDPQHAPGLNSCILVAGLHSRKNFLSEYNFSESEAKKFKSIAAAIISLQLTYSEFTKSGCVADNIKALGLALEDLSADEKDVDRKTFFKDCQDTINAIGTEQQVPLKNSSTHKIQVIKLPYASHSAFCIIEDYGDGETATISYCDGNLPLSEINEFGYGYGQVKYAVRPELLPNIAAKVKEAFGNGDIMDVDGRYNIDSLNQALAQVVKCDENGLPQVVHKGLPTKPQKKGNCSTKALNMGVKEVLSMQYPEMEFEQEEDGDFFSGGDGSELYKTYKHGVIRHDINVVLRAAQELGAHSDGEFKKILGAVLNESMRDIFLHSIAKGDVELMSILYQNLQDSGTEIRELKNSYNENALLIAARNQRPQAFAWCLQAGFELGCAATDEELSEQDQELYRIITAPHEDSAELLTKFLDHRVADRHVPHLISYAKKNKNEELAEELLQKFSRTKELTKESGANGKPVARASTKSLQAAHAQPVAANVSQEKVTAV